MFPKYECEYVLFVARTDSKSGLCLEVRRGLILLQTEIRQILFNENNVRVFWNIGDEFISCFCCVLVRVDYDFKHRGHSIIYIV